MLKFNELGVHFYLYPVLLLQNLLISNCSYFINKDEWLPNLPDLSPLDYRACG